MDKLLMVVGMARSGTTLLAEKLHTIGVSIGEETHALVTPALDTWCRSDAPVEELFRLSPRMKPYRHLKDHLEENRPRSTDELLWALSEGHRQHVGYPLAGEKTPYHWKHAKRLLSQNPGLHVIFCIRDPRDVIDSHFRVAWGRRCQYALAREWALVSKLAAHLARTYPGRVRVHNHEAFLHDHERMLAAYKAWLDLGEVPNRKPLTSFQADEADWKGDARKPPNPDKAHAWKRRQGQALRYARYAAIAGKQLRTHGYETVRAPLGKTLMLRLLARGSLFIENTAKRIVISQASS
ncbi:MAG: sulfotransferase [Thermoplasmatota archaeon]